MTHLAELKVVLMLVNVLFLFNVLLQLLYKLFLLTDLRVIIEIAFLKNYEPK